MNKMIYLFFIAIISVLLWQWQMEGNTQNDALLRGKRAVNRAGHDASLQIDKAALANGQIIYDQPRATLTFEETLKKNMQLDNTLQALPNTLFRGPVEIVYEDFIDDGNVVAKVGSAFDGTGKLYDYQTTNYHIQSLIYGPAVAYVIKVKKPIEIDPNQQTYYYIGGIYEYPH